MSIRPEGGWGEFHEEPKSAEPVLASAPADSIARRYLTCKVCDSGTLRSRRVHRLSGPAVVIGYIILIPSIVGILTCAALLIGLNLTRSGSGSSHLSQSKADAMFRQTCAQKVRAQVRIQGYYPSQPAVEAFCECELSTLKVTGSQVETAEVCNQRAQEGTLQPVSQSVDAFYSEPISRVNQENASWGLNPVLRGLSDTFIIGVGISVFVSGLLGWLLVMKKRVLQCDRCGAVINAS